jgi:hypothetical protein
VHDVNSPLRSGSITRYSESIIIPGLQPTPLERILRHWAQRDLGAAFDAWTVFVKAHKRAVQLGTRMRQHWLNRALSAAYNSFSDQVEDTKETKRKLARVISKWTISALWLGWDAWLEGIEVQADERAQAERTQDKGRQVVLKMLNASLAHAFEAWVDGTRHKRQARHVCTRVVMRIRSRMREHAFDRFYVYVEERRINMRKVVHKLQCLLLEHTFGSWHDAMVDCRMEVGCNNIFCKVRTGHLCMQPLSSKCVACSFLDQATALEYI